MPDFELRADIRRGLRTTEGPYMDYREIPTSKGVTYRDCKDEDGTARVPAPGSETRSPGVKTGTAYLPVATPAWPTFCKKPHACGVDFDDIAPAGMRTGFGPLSENAVLGHLKASRVSARAGAR